ncbi:MAG: sugar transferase, partial [Paludibacter sp.]|nr:sugar transferase [Paludibacter sp.]
FLNKIYFIFSQCKNRIISKAEVFGRFYCFGYEIVSDKKIGKINFAVAQRTKQPESFIKRTYGPFIKLRRTGKNGKIFNVYKMRTMHPYSEYLQKYIYKNNRLAAGGKFNHDLRINTLGKCMRKYWIDELPMLLNLIKGEMKIVGVRPLSVQYFNLYSKELQEKRVKFKPGLLPPFYADMPKTLDEIQDSEMKYLTEYETKGQLRTDLKYFFLILKNILLKKARSS